mgnify:CR=1 FL=1
MFLASKLLAFFIEPLFWVLLLMLASLLLVRRRPRAGRALCWAALLALVLGSWTSGPEALLRQPPSVQLQLAAGRWNGWYVLGWAVASTPESAGTVAAPAGADVASPLSPAPDVRPKVNP